MSDQNKTSQLEPGLLEAMRDSDNPPVLFIGSGVSCAAGLVSWDDLIGQMKDILGRGMTTGRTKEVFDGLSHLDIAEYFRMKVGNEAYYRFLRKQFRDTPFKLTALHRAIAALPVRTIITTNYDKVLECTFRNQWGIDPVVIVYENQLPCFDPRQRVIVKIHGDIDHPDSIVLTASDYSRFDDSKNELRGRLKNVLGTSTVLIVGFGFRDSNFQDQFWHMRGFFHEKNLAIFAVVDRLNPVIEHIWSTWGISVIRTNSRIGITRYIRSLGTLI